MCCLWLLYTRQMFIVKILCIFPVIIAKLHIPSGRYGDVDTLAEAIAKLYQHVLFGLYGINTHPQMLFT